MMEKFDMNTSNKVVEDIDGSGLQLLVLALTIRVVLLFKTWKVQ
jgi:hypothetical protein